jgi:hypothetical protein
MTAWGTVDLAVEAMRRGVCDFVQKPWDNTRLLHILRKQVKQVRARRNAKWTFERDRLRQTHLDRELTEERALQNRLLATGVPELEGCEIAVEWQPATMLGGDYIAAFNIGTPKFCDLYRGRRWEGIASRTSYVKLPSSIKNLGFRVAVGQRSDHSPESNSYMKTFR